MVRVGSRPDAQVAGSLHRAPEATGEDVGVGVGVGLGEDFGVGVGEGLGVGVGEGRGVGVGVGLGMGEGLGVGEGLGLALPDPHDWAVTRPWPAPTSEDRPRGPRLSGAVTARKNNPQTIRHHARGRIGPS